MAKTDTQYAKPLPSLDGLAKEFYDWCRRGELRLQRCRGCRGWRHVPRSLCPECGSAAWEWAPSSGRGSVFTWTVTTRALHPAFKGDVPYAAVVVEMEEGVRVLSWVVDCPPDDLAFGMPVEVVFQDVTPEVTLPYFRRADPNIVGQGPSRADPKAVAPGPSPARSRLGPGPAEKGRGRSNQSWT